MYPLLSATRMFPPNCPGPGRWSCLASVPCISSGIYSWLLGVRAGFSPWQSWQSGPLEGAGCPVSVSTFLRRKGPRICFTRLLGQGFGWGGCGHQLGLSLGVSRMLATGSWCCPQLSRTLPLGSPALPGWVTQAEIRAGRRPQSWAIYGHTLGAPAPHPHSGTG